MYVDTHCLRVSVDVVSSLKGSCISTGYICVLPRCLSHSRLERRLVQSVMEEDFGNAQSGQDSSAKPNLKTTELHRTHHDNSFFLFLRIDDNHGLRLLVVLLKMHEHS